MPFTTNDPIVAASRGTVEQALAYAASRKAQRPNDVESYVRELQRLCLLPEVGIDFSLAFGQWCDETGVGTTDYWIKYLNPAGIGALETLDRPGQITYVGLTYASGEDAARAHVVHLYVYAKGKITKSHPLHAYIDLDPRYEAAISSGYAGKANTLGYLSTRWAANPNYANQIVAHCKEAFDGKRLQATGADLAALARSQIGKPYRYAGKGPDAFDCSGLVAWCAAQLGLNISGDSHAQFNLGSAVSKDALLAGDILCFDTQDGTEVREGNTSSHVGIYLGTGEMVSALNEQKGVIVSDPFSSYFAPRFLGARRIMEAPQMTDTTPVKIDPYKSLPFPLTVWLINPSQTNQRPGIRQTARWVNVHETGNERVGATARMHAQWQHDGCPGVADTQIGVHFYVDDKEAFQMLPLDEVSWNAGCGSCEGNYAAISFEICVNADGDRARARANAAKLIAAVMKQLNLSTQSIKFHIDWSGKWCPAVILNEGRKEEMRQMIINEFLGKKTPVYVEPVPVDGFDGSKDVQINGITFHAEMQSVTAAKTTSVRQYASPSSSETRAPLSKDEQFDVLGWVDGQDIEGEKRWWITASYSRVWVGGTVEKPTINVPDLPEPPEVVVKNGKRFYPAEAGRVVTIVNTVNLRKWASPNGEVIKVLKPGEEIKVAYWVRGEKIEDEDIWWILDTVDGPRLWSGATDSRPY